MDNYYHQCREMMEDGRFMTDYRSSQVREEHYRYKHGLKTANETRTHRIDNAEQMMDDEWDDLVNNNLCFPRKKCYHTSDTTRVTNAYNNIELLSYNGMHPAPDCDRECNCNNQRLTRTKGIDKKRNCKREEGDCGYGERCPPRKYGKRILPDNLRISQQY
jgi:hypothetical protein